MLRAFLPIFALSFGLFIEQPAFSVEREAQEQVYVCPMHSDARSATPGSCKRCGMTLRLTNASPVAEASTNLIAGRVDNLRIPDTTVFDQAGRELHFYSDLVQGKTVAINFLFTTCTTICPPLAATFHKVQQGLGDRAGKDIVLISISVDPVVDIPVRLKSFAEKFHAAPGWTFVTGGKGEIDKLLEALGASVANKNDHTPMILVGNDAAKYWTRAYGLAPAATLLKVIGEVADKKRESE